MSLTIKKVPTVLSIHQMDEEEDPKFAGAVRRCCRAGKKLPTLTFAPESARDSRLMKKVRSFGSFDDLACRTSTGTPTRRPGRTTPTATRSRAAATCRTCRRLTGSCSPRGKIGSPRVSFVTTSPRARPRWCPAVTASSRSSTRAGRRRRGRRSLRWTKSCRRLTAASLTLPRLTRRRSYSRLSGAIAR